MPLDCDGCAPSRERVGEIWRPARQAGAPCRDHFQLSPVTRTTGSQNAEEIALNFVHGRGWPPRRVHALEVAVVVGTREYW